MTDAKRGYYCLIQYCPDPGRLEVANLGVLLFSPEAGFLDARMAVTNERVRKFFGADSFENWSLNSAKEALHARLRADRESFQSLQDLEHFVNTRANDLILSAPRPVKVVHPERTLDDLYRDLVDARPKRERRGPVLPELDRVFRHLHGQGRAALDVVVEVPVLERRLRIPYAYRNGVLNLVKPERFPDAEAAAKERAMKLAVEGDLIQRHGGGGEQQTKLVVVSSFASPADGGRLVDGVARILGEYRVKTVLPAFLPAFLQEVEQQAHEVSTRRDGKP